MSELDPESRSLIEQARGAEDPTLADRARVRKRLVLALGGAVGASIASAAGRGVDSGTHLAHHASIPAAAKSATLLGLVKAGSLKIALLLGLGALAGGGALVWSGRHGTSPKELEVASPSLPSPKSVAPRPGELPRAPGAPLQPESEAAKSGEASPDAPTGAAEPAAPPAAAGTPSAAAAETAPRAATAQLEEPGLAPQPVLPRAQSSVRRARLSLAEEARELGAVHAALRDGQPRAALARLEAMDRRPGGALGEERLAARVLSLCGLGRIYEAESAARRFRKLAPESPLLPRLAGSCAGRALNSGNAR